VEEDTKATAIIIITIATVALSLPKTTNRRRPITNNSPLQEVETTFPSIMTTIQAHNIIKT
jgi:hypothetical protein